MKKDYREFFVSNNDRLIDAVKIIKDSKFRCAIVVSKNKVVAVISEGDILKALLKGASVYSSIKEWANYSFKFLLNKDYDQALILIKTYGLTVIPIIDKDFFLVDIITISDVLNKINKVE